MHGTSVKRRYRGRSLVLLCVFVVGCAGGDPTPTPTARITPTAGPTATDRPAPPTVPQPTDIGRPTADRSPIASGPPQTADLLLVNGRVLTVDGEFSIAGAVAVASGRIIAVGDDAGLRTLAGGATRVIDLEGRTLLPGIVDPHTHSLQHEAHAGQDALDAAEEELIRNGRTTIGTPGIQPDELEALQGFAASGRSRLRLHIYLAYNDFCDAELGHWYRDVDFSRDPALRQAIAGIKIFYDGGACDAPAVTFDWDTHRWQGRGDLFVDAAEVGEVIATADSLRAQVIAHSAGDRALDAGLDGLELALAGRPNANRHRIDHLMFVRPDQLDRLGPLGVPPVLFGTHQSCLDTEDSSVVRYLDEEQLGWLEPRRQIIDANPQVAAGWHSDTPLLSISIFEHLAALTGMGERLGQPAGCESDVLRGHAITTREAIELMTIGAAHAMQLEDEIGSIEADKAADLLVLARDPLPLSGADHLDNAVVATIIDGRIAWCDRDQAAFCEGDATPSPTEVPGGAPVRASAHIGGGEPDRILDGDPDTGWMAGAEPPQWIELDIGSVEHVAILRLHVDQHPAGFTRHIVYGGSEPSPSERLAVVEGATEYGQLLEVLIDRPVRYVRVETVESPSWVGWLDIEVIGAP